MLHSEDGVRWLLRCIDVSLTGVALPVADSKQIVLFALCCRGSSGYVNRRVQHLLETLGICCVLGWGFVTVCWLVFGIAFP